MKPDPGRRPSPPAFAAAGVETDHRFAVRFAAEVLPLRQKFRVGVEQVVFTTEVEMADLEDLLQVVLRVRLTQAIEQTRYELMLCGRCGSVDMSIAQREAELLLGVGTGQQRAGFHILVQVDRNIPRQALRFQDRFGVQPPDVVHSALGQDRG